MSMSYRIEQDGRVSIHDFDGSEIVCWIPDEYRDIMSAAAMLNAIRLVGSGRFDELRVLLQDRPVPEGAN